MHTFWSAAVRQMKQAILFSAVLPFAACGQQSTGFSHTKVFSEMMQSGGERMKDTRTTLRRQDTATFAAGCFWCVDAQFRQLKGVEKVVSGFTGGTVPDPTYEQVCTGTTGHAEACNIIYDPSVISYDALLAAFFVAHDPTQLNRQGNDVGTQYRSAIFYHDAEQKRLADYYIGKLNTAGAYPRPIVTQVAPYTVLYKAEGYHQDYYSKNGNAPYCQFVIKPKLDKFEKVFKNQLKTSE